MTNRVTAMDVESQEFPRKMRGYDPEQVQMYLRSVAEEIERLQLENGRMREEAGGLRSELKDLREREQTLQQTLVAAQKMAEEMKERAREESDLVVKQARLQAEQITHQAQDVLLQLEADITRSKLERERLERGLRGVIDQHGALLDLRREAEGELDNVRVMPHHDHRVGTEVG
jgi:cell division initiation protein